MSRQALPASISVVATNLCAVANTRYACDLLAPTTHANNKSAGNLIPCSIHHPTDQPAAPRDTLQAGARDLIVIQTVFRLPLHNPLSVAPCPQT
jgi:hypothetical protein